MLLMPTAQCLLACSDVCAALLYLNPECTCTVLLPTLRRTAATDGAVHHDCALVCGEALLLMSLASVPLLFSAGGS